MASSPCPPLPSRCCSPVSGAAASGSDCWAVNSCVLCMFQPPAKPLLPLCRALTHPFTSNSSAACWCPTLTAEPTGTAGVQAATDGIAGRKLLRL